jgi:hypothetical protein
MYIQQGKDLSEVDTVIGTGGIFARHPQARAMLLGAMTEKQDLSILTPRQPKCFLDRRYIFWAAGLLAEKEPEAGLKLLKRYLVAL